MMQIRNIVVSAVLSLSTLWWASAYAHAADDGLTAFANAQYEQAFALFSEEYTAGTIASGYFKARMIELGVIAENDVEQAGVLYLQTAKAGYPASFNRVGLMYYRGELGVKRDESQAAEYFRKGADIGEPNALFNLSRLYFQGAGVPRDEKRAHKLLQQAAAQDHILALNSLGALYSKHTASEGKLQGQAYFERSAALGNAVGLYQTGMSYLHKGPDADNLKTAHKYFNLASARGHTLAKEALQSLTEQLSAQDLAQAQEAAQAFTAEPQKGAQ